MVGYKPDFRYRNSKEIVNLSLAVKNDINNIELILDVFGLKMFSECSLSFKLFL